MSASNTRRLHLWIPLAALGVLAFWVTDASAYPTYESCETCHDGFIGGPGHALHDSHQGPAGGNCFLCHEFIGDLPNIALSADGSRGCVGCHGRQEDAGNDVVVIPIPGAPITLEPSPGLGAGLRQHHDRSGVTECAGCHGDTDTSDPATYTPVGEDVLPPFYAGLSLDPCADGLDNDGDGLTDADDPDCTPTNDPPIVDLGGPYSGFVGEPVDFEITADDPDGDDVTIEWLDFGDGSTPSTPPGPTASHTYDAPGTYTVALNVSDGPGGHADAYEFDVTIEDVPPPPEGNTWSVRMPLLSAEATVEFEEFAGILLVQITLPDGSSSMGIGMEWDGVIFWMDMNGAIFFGSINHDAGTMSGIVFGWGGASSIFMADKI